MKVLGFLGMIRDVPPTALDPVMQPVPDQRLPMRELVNVDPSELPVLTPRLCWEFIEATTPAVFPRGTT